MNISHPSEEEIQQYALDKSARTPDLISHIENCELCREEVSTYQSLFSGIAQQPTPVFDFDLSALVIPQLEKAYRQTPADRIVAGFLVVFVCFCAAVPAYLFRQNFLYLFSGISTFFLYAILCSAMIIVAFKAFKMYRKYQQQMQSLNFN
jgi:hypothetical protein